ncbi:MAG: hypothetical protein SYNGOMJ08_00812 [Candidatus Syntrophoarchaeum sp. GoM_oil]|nr:MAG: hypothetical protein SYNGOMJ08_00812 [Candidatus Syntrophoarchaeum sp. GoM_oil]
MDGDEDNHPLVKGFEHYEIEATAVKFRGVVENEPSGPYDIEVRIDEILLDPEGTLSSGDIAYVDIAEDPSECDVVWPVHKGDQVEVYAKHYEYDCWQGYYAVCAWIYSRDNPKWLLEACR